MTSVIHVDLASARVADELADYLCSHGLAARVVDAKDHCELEVADAIPPDERLRQTFEDALRTWLSTACVPLIPVERSELSYVLRFPGD
jgi:hypothetical protein